MNHGDENVEEISSLVRTLQDANINEPPKSSQSTTGTVPKRSSTSSTSRPLEVDDLDFDLDIDNIDVSVSFLN